MKPVFSDTSYYGAILNPKDASHEKAIRWCQTSRRQMVTTEFILVELGNACAAPEDRQAFQTFLEDLHADDDATVVPASSELYQRGLDLFLDRPDKEWSLTDCISFVVMEDHGLTDALTADHHFEQAGFKALLR